MIQEFKKINKVEGEINLPGDKSISHRAVMFSSIAEGNSTIKNISNGEDVNTTINCFKKMSVEIEGSNNKLIIKGKGFKNLINPNCEIYCGNSGTTARLISGILSGQNFTVTLTGDESLSKRPMKRIITPLSLMGTKFESNENETLPLKISPPKELTPVTYELPVASAQVKSAILLAGLFCEEETTVIEKEQTRNHTETMLGLPVNKNENKFYIKSSKKHYPEAKEYFVPSDISTAAFFIVLGLILNKSSILIQNVSLNPTRTGIIDILKEMGGKILINNEKTSGGELYGDLEVFSSSLKNINIKKEIIPNIIDEIPILSVAGLFADGDFNINNSMELRAKESDRINSLIYNYKLLGLEVSEFEDGFSVSGKIKNKVEVFESFGDHRIAMTFGILSSLLKEGGKVNNFESVNISNPFFIEQLKLIAR